MDLKTVAGQAGGYAGGAVVLLLLGQMLRGGMWHGAVPLILAALVVVPPCRKWISAKVGFAISGGATAVLAFVLCGLGITLSMNQLTDKDKKKEQMAATAMQQRVAEKRAQFEEEYARDKTTILANARNLLAQGKAKEAKASLARFARISDLDLMRLRDNAALAALREELKGAAPERRGPLQAEIGKLDPSDTKAVKEGAAYAAKVVAEQKQAAAVLAGKENLKRQISAWDGSHRAVTERIKASLKSPGSYEHEKTGYIDNGDGSTTVVTRYHATNSFNAIVPGRAMATVGADGAIVAFSMQ